MAEQSESKFNNMSVRQLQDLLIKYHEMLFYLEKHLQNAPDSHKSERRKRAKHILEMKSRQIQSALQARRHYANHSVAKKIFHILRYRRVAYASANQK